jgi:hypothetical protein
MFIRKFFPAVLAALLAATITADRQRLDAGRTHPGYGPNHGYIVTISRSGAPAGARICVFAINARGSNPSLGCRTL